jgi:hypothetical protein
MVCVACTSTKEPPKLESIYPGKKSQLRPLSPAQKLLIELDGEVHFISDQQATKFYFPATVRSVAIRDEEKRMRAHLLVEGMPASLFDADRLEVSLQLSDQVCMLVRRTH